MHRSIVSMDGWSIIPKYGGGSSLILITSGNSSLVMSPFSPLVDIGGEFSCVELHDTQSSLMPGHPRLFGPHNDAGTDGFDHNISTIYK